MSTDPKVRRLLDDFHLAIVSADRQGIRVRNALTELNSWNGVPEHDPATAPADVLDMRPTQFCVCVEPHGDHWRNGAACRPGSGVDPDDFTPTGTGEPAQAQARRAKAVCAACPVRERCLDDGVARGDDWAVLGGLTAAERRAAIRAGTIPAPAGDQRRRRLLDQIRRFRAKGYGGRRLAKMVGLDPHELAEVEQTAKASAG